MDWTELCVEIPLEQADSAVAIASVVADGGLYIEDYSDLEQNVRDIAHSDLIDEQLLTRDRSKAILHLYIPPDAPVSDTLEFLQARLAAEQISCRFMENTVREEDWANNWKQYFKPLPVGERLVICPTWETLPEDNERLRLLIDPGMAFGTGGHETTRLVLETVERYVTPDTAFLDVGCGSGILAIAACLLGADHAVGVDIDATAVRTAKENGEVNGLTEPRYTILAGDLVKQVKGTYQVIAANIVADAIIMLSPAIPALLAPEGVYIVSGIIDSREQDVLTALEQTGFSVIERHERGCWVCLTCRYGG